ncbi:MAG: hypothetical protein D6725_06565 [Planctomycetota bacterium]|nr:MAG: hypothetical protein D6725_06565 [Planctomycetota bacterium]
MPTADELIGKLRSPDAFPHPVTAVEIVETHISWVLLTGRFAYKIKKPVDFGFLDFSTLRKRLVMCREEVRLNRRTAAELYLDVVAIVPRDDGAVAVGPSVLVPAQTAALPAEPIEYAVKMRQFDQRELFDRRLRDGRLTDADVDDLADRVALFHRSIDVLPSDAPYGTPEILRAAMEDNFATLRDTVPQLPPATPPPADSSDSPQASRPPLADRLRTLEQWHAAAFPRLAPVVQRRRDNGFVRECHGDLHLRNIVRLPEGVRMFDCIEFNPAFRWIDVLDDVAFAVMDFADHRRWDWGFRLLNRYLEHTGDYEHLQILPFYICYRSLVRAKVAALRWRQQVPEQLQTRAEGRETATGGAGASASAKQPHRFRRGGHGSGMRLDPDDAFEQAAAVAEYVDLALRARRPSAPRVVVLCGVSASGKSTCGQRLLENLRLIRIRSDVERKRLFGLPRDAHSGSRLNAGIYAPSATEQTYARLHALAAKILDADFGVLVDATCLQRWQRLRFQELAARRRIPFHIVWLDTPPEECRRRLRAREDQVSEATLEVLEQQLASFEPFDPSETPHVVRVLPETPAEEVLRSLRLPADS